MSRNLLTDDVRIQQIRPLIPPAILIEEFPVSDQAQETISGARKAIRDILHGLDDRLLAIVGPCSIHDVAAAREYGERLREHAERHRGKLLVIMRTYFEKPRTVGGWKGFMNDPDLDESHQINKGLREARHLLYDLTQMGLPTACEFLDNILPQYIADFIAWAAIGARTSESQIHREFASGCSMPVGFKNSTTGQTRIAIDAVRAAGMSHWFPSVTKQGVSAILQTSGNDATHVILRGGSSTGPNHDAETVQNVAARLRELSLPPRLMIDCSHGNSGKDHTRQMGVIESIAEQVSAGETAIMGVMIESHLKEGKQTLGGDLEYGKSITDACVGIEETGEMLDRLAALR